MRDRRTVIKQGLALAATSAAVLGSGLPARASRPVLRFVYTRPKDNPVTLWHIRIFTEALNRLGFGFAFIEVPPMRASHYASSGEVDGELGRVHDYDRRSPALANSLVRVEEHTTRVVFSAFSSDPAIAVEGWESLGGTPHLVDFRLGIKRAADRLPGLVPTSQLHEVATIAQAAKRLLAGRSDILVDVEDHVVRYLRSEEYRQIKQRQGGGREIRNAGILEQTTGHAWLNEAHRDLAPRLARVLREMKAEGLFADYLKRVGVPESQLRW